ncbi:putative gamma-aminobutyric acid type B receptor subunit 2-like [Apostichopus japonicus]|uniref:Gamma-aminobutyric acid type B receptor subunit 2 n=1 Tax=Stichopus japonicus TaxID=307972 RepID=A0A2G8K137_STIJA|nr:putative gamma-aminobutyric acid type B receptor subunit 2-like [Apostichopus japonicus]
MQSTITEALAEVTGIWKTIQVNQASSSPNLSDRNKYPYFFRALGPPYNLNDLQSIVLQEFNWAKVAVIHEGKQPHSGVTDHLQQTLHMNNVSILASESFYNDPADAMARLKNKDVRIIIGNFDQQMALDVFCNAFKLGMYGPKYVFFIVGYYSHHWWKGSAVSQYGCDVTEMEEVVEGYFSLTYSTNGRIDKQTVSGRV